jgi:hypothetical protein
LEEDLVSKNSYSVGYFAEKDHGSERDWHWYGGWRKKRSRQRSGAGIALDGEHLGRSGIVMVAGRGPVGIAALGGVDVSWVDFVEGVVVAELEVGACSGMIVQQAKWRGMEV